MLHDTHIALMFVYGPQNKQRLLPHTTLTDLFCITEGESVYCALRAESFYTKRTRFFYKGLAE